MADSVLVLNHFAETNFAETPLHLLKLILLKLYFAQTNFAETNSVNSQILGQIHSSMSRESNRKYL